MAGTASIAGRQAARLGLLTAALAACATVQDPPGGPPDFTAPVLLTTHPDSGAVLPGFRDRASLQFDEVVSEASGGGLANLVVLSPRPTELEVRWKRTRLEVRPDGGWQPGVVYHLRILPGLTDLSNNRSDDGHLLVFSTGVPIPDTRLSGTVLDWENARAAPASLIEVVLLPDSLVYVAIADSAGDFTIAALPLGTYQLFATVDANRNGRRDRREAYDSTTIMLDSTLAAELWAFVHDTVGPQLSRAARLDSLHVRLNFNLKLQPGAPDSGAVRLRLLPDSIDVPIAAVWLPATYDSVRAVERAVRDSIAADSIAADSVAADSAAAADTLVALPARPDTVRAAPAVPPPGATPDTNRIRVLLAQRPRLVDEWIVRLVAPLTPGARYVVEATATNVSGATTASVTLLIVPDSTAAGAQ